MGKAVYAGSFDPLTNGHLWMIKTGSRIFEELIVAIGTNPDKRYTFIGLKGSFCVAKIWMEETASFWNL